MSGLDMLSHLSAPSAVHGAPFGVEVLGLIQAIEAKSVAALYVARDDKVAAAALKLAQFYRPALEVIRLPGWDVLPYDRVSPSPAVAAARCAASASKSTAPLAILPKTPKLNAYICICPLRALIAPSTLA